MVDEEQYRRAYRDVVDRPCAYQKAVLASTCQCCKAQRTNIAEREAINCSDQHAHQRCCDLLALMRDKANFALGLTRTPGELPHAKSMRIQCGGLQGLQQALTAESHIDDIFGLLEQACDGYGDLADFPFQAIIQAINHYQGRRRRKRQ